MRQNFPHIQNQVYLNHAATAPLSVPVLSAMNDFLAERHGKNIDNYFKHLPKTIETREWIAELLGTQAAFVDFAANTSDALNTLALGLDWKAGDRIAIPACEFPANVYPFLALEKLGVEIDWIPHQNSTFSLSDIQRALTPKTRLLTLSWVQFLSGFKTNLAEAAKLCQANGTLFCVDAIQGLGALSIDSVEDLGIDFLACGVQKWMMGDQGLAFFYSSEKLLNQLKPTKIGWLGIEVNWNDFYDYQLKFHPDATRFRTGTANNLGITAFHAALKLYREMNPKNCETQVLALNQILKTALPKFGFEIYGSTKKADASGICTVSHPQAEAIFQHLLAENITISYRNKLLRFSPTWYNNEADLAKVFKALGSFF